MRILLVITSLGVGGAERLVTSLADRYVDLGHEVTIAYLEDRQSMHLPKSEKVNLVHLKLTRTPIGFIRILMNIRKLIKEIKPNVVHSHMYHPNILTRLLRIFTPIERLVSSAHNTNEGGGIRMLSYRLTDRWADISTNVSNEAVEKFIEKSAVKPERMVPVLNGIDLNKFKFQSGFRNKIRSDFKISQKSFLLAVGRLDEQKDYSNLLRAIKELSLKRQDFKFFIAGDGPLKSKLEETKTTLGIESYVEFLGIRLDVPDLMSAADIFVLSSAWEGFGLVVAEAMACERLVVATDCGGVKEVVGENGLLVEPRNSAALADSLNKALDMTKGEREAIGKMARQRIVEKYSLNANADAYLALYTR